MRISLCTCCIAVLVGCRPAAPPAPTKPAVTNAAAPAPAPITVEEAERACVTAVLDLWSKVPGLAPNATIAHAAPIERGRIVCAVELRGAELVKNFDGLPLRTVHVELAVLTYEDDEWWANVSAEGGTFDEGRAEQGGRGVEIKLEPLPIGDGETAVLITMAQHEDGPEYGESTVRAALYRAVGDQLELAYEASWTSTTGEAEDIERRTITLAETSTGGFRVLEVSVDRTIVERADGESCPVEYTFYERWIWDKRAYTLADTDEDLVDTRCHGTQVDVEDLYDREADNDESID